MICRECGSKMYLDDQDIRSRGIYDNYWCCTQCQTSCIEQIRGKKPFREYWHSESGAETKDYTIRGGEVI